MAAPGSVAQCGDHCDRSGRAGPCATERSDRHVDCPKPPAVRGLRFVSVCSSRSLARRSSSRLVLASDTRAPARRLASGISGGRSVGRAVCRSEHGRWRGSDRPVESAGPDRSGLRDLRNAGARVSREIRAGRRAHRCGKRSAGTGFPRGSGRGRRCRLASNAEGSGSTADRRGLVAAWVVAFVFAFGELGASILVSPPGESTLPIRIYTLIANTPASVVAALRSSSWR